MNIFKQIKTTQDKLLEYENVLKCYDKDEKIKKIIDLEGNEKIKEMLNDLIK